MNINRRRPRDGDGGNPNNRKKGNEKMNPIEIQHLPPSVRRRIEKAVGLAKPEREHKVFVYGTLLSNECNCDRAPRARRQRAWTPGTIYDTGYGFPAFVKRGRTRVKGEVLTVGDDGFRSMDRLEGYPSFYRRERIQVNLVGGGRVLAWVYIMNRLPKDAKVIEGGDWRTYRRSSCPNR